MLSARPQARLLAGARDERTLAAVACMPLFGLAAHPDHGDAMPLPLRWCRGDRLHFEGSYELVRACNPAKQRLEGQKDAS